MSGDTITSQRDCGHILGMDTERILNFNATDSPVHLLILIASQNQALVKRIGMAIFQSAACVRCDKEECLAVVIIAAVSDSLKKVEHAKQCIELRCPAYNRVFTVPFRDVEYRDV